VEHPAIIVAVLCFIVMAALMDWQQRRIPNRLNFVAMVVALTLQVVTSGLDGLIAGLLGVTVGLAVLFLPFAAGMVGGGDVKFIAAVGAFLGWKTTLAGLAVGVVLGGVAGAVTLVRRGRLGLALRGLRSDLLCISNGVRPTTLKTSCVTETIPYGVFLAMGIASYLAIAML
jgi:prepilin peptidase CpaA